MVKLIDRIREAEATLAVRLEEEKRQAEEAQRKLDEEDRIEGRRKAKLDVPNIDAKILCAVDDKQSVYTHPIGRGREKAALTPFEEGYTSCLLEHYADEGVDAKIEKLPLYRNGVVAAHDINIRFSWLGK
jgi:hypothetical protein